MEAFSELALDRYFERYWNKPISIALPSNLGGRYIEGDGILSQLNLSNIHHREIFSLMFPEIIELLQTSYISAEDMEAAFMAISPEFAGISESFFDKDGRRINNAFADVLTKIGSNERYYAGFELSTSEISDEARASIQEGFSMLPEALKQLFLANEIIANKVYYKKGSISDAIGVDIFRGGLSEIYNEFYDDVSAGNVFENAEMEERFYDYVSTLSGMTPYVEESKIGLENNTEYFHTYKRAGDGSYTVHYKQRAEDADAKPIYKLTPRAGITMDPRYSIISNIPYLTLTGEELVELEDGDKPITKFYIKGHGYKRGYYITEMGTSVHVNPEGNIVTITKKEIPANYTRQETPMQEYDDYVFDERYANKESNYYEGNIKPEPNTIFVFGSNPEGRHGAGAAKVAREQFGAIYGQGEGLQGNAYALPTKDLRTPDWARTSNNSYEVSSRGDSRFSALNAKFKQGTMLFGHDVGGRTIESVYQHGVKQGDWTTDNNSKTGTPKDKTIITGNTEDASYEQGYLPLWREWAKQNPELIEELSQKAHGKTLTDQFASTRVSQARALSDIIKDTKSYKSISPEQITASIKTLYEVAKQNPNKQFKVAYRNTTDTSLNGYTGLEMIEMFNQAGTIPSNVIFSKEWVDTGKLNTQSEITPLVRNIESYMKERINLINEIINSNKSELPVKVLSEMSMDQLRNILKC